MFIANENKSLLTNFDAEIYLRSKPVGYKGHKIYFIIKYFHFHFPIIKSWKVKKKPVK
jgi:hypothetical protein